MISAFMPVRLCSYFHCIFFSSCAVVMLGPRGSQSGSLLKIGKEGSREGFISKTFPGNINTHPTS